MRKTTLLLCFCVCFFIYALLRYPAAMLAASAQSIQLWLTKVFPSLFPFLAACGLLLRIGAAERMGVLCRPIMKPLFGLSGIAAFPFALGLLSGYPAGAKITAMLYEKGLISTEEAQHILVFSNNAGPLFLIGTIGTGFFGIPAFGYLLLLSSVLGAITAGILWRLRAKKRPAPAADYPAAAASSPSDALAAAVNDALGTILQIGGYLILFGAFSEGMRQVGCFTLLSRLLFFLPLSAEGIQGIFSGLLEMTNGAYLLSIAADDLPLRLSLIAFLVCFGGLSILGQTLGVLSAVPICKGEYIKGKLLHALCGALFCRLLYPLFSLHTQKAVPAFFSLTETAFTLSILWLLPAVFFLYALCLAARK